MTVSLLLLAAFCAGVLDGVAGGGGLIQLPALLAAFPQRETVELLGTGKVAATIGTSGSAATYMRRITIARKLVVAMAIPAFIGSIGGALVASHLPTQALKPMVLIVLTGVAIYTWRRPSLGERELLKHEHSQRLRIGAFYALAIGFYDGVVGPGTGNFLMLTFVAVMGYSFLQAAPMAKLVNITTNLGALIVFGVTGAVIWGLGLAMGAANLVGAFLGARIGLRGGSVFIRKAFLLVTSLLILKIGVDIYQSW